MTCGHHCCNAAINAQQGIPLVCRPHRTLDRRTFSEAKHNHGNCIASKMDGGIL
jgi:hypothetical protein